MARSKLTKELTEQMCQAVASGLTYEGACDLVRLPRSTFYDWMKRGEDGVAKQWSDFSDAIKEARAKRDQRYVAVIEDAAAGGTWQAAAWWKVTPRSMLNARFRANQLGRLAWGEASRR